MTELAISKLLMPVPIPHYSKREMAATQGIGHLPGQQESVMTLTFQLSLSLSLRRQRRKSQRRMRMRMRMRMKTPPPDQFCFQP